MCPIEDSPLKEFFRVGLTRCSDGSIRTEVLMHESDLLDAVVICDYLRPRSGWLEGASAQTVLVDHLAKCAGLRPLPIVAGVEALSEFMRFNILPGRRSPQC